MFCKYCGNIMTGEICSKCGKENPLTYRSDELDQLMRVTPVANASTDTPRRYSQDDNKRFRSDEKEAFRKGREEGYIEGITNAKLKYNKLLSRYIAIAVCISVIFVGLTFFIGRNTGNKEGYIKATKYYNETKNNEMIENQRIIEEKSSLSYKEGYRAGLLAPGEKYYVQFVQKCLNNLEYYDGDVDGKRGTQTNSAIIKFATQEELLNEMPSTPEEEDDQARKLIVDEQFITQLKQKCDESHEKKPQEQVSSNTKTSTFPTDPPTDPPTNPPTPTPKPAEYQTNISAENEVETGELDS